jgi:hypothetical protein
MVRIKETKICSSCFLFFKTRHKTTWKGGNSLLLFLSVLSLSFCLLHRWNSFENQPREEGEQGEQFDDEQVVAVEQLEEEQILQEEAAATTDIGDDMPLPPPPPPSLGPSANPVPTVTRPTADDLTSKMGKLRAVQKVERNVEKETVSDHRTEIMSRIRKMNSTGVEQHKVRPST